MAKPWEMTRDDIEEWASRSPIEATAVLPRLVRRLLFATSPLGQIDMRAGGGTRYEGWDGTVRARGGTAFCPAELSVWELSVESDPRQKLNKDYKKRSAKPPEGVRPALATYIAVTARAVPRKAEWIAARKTEGIWREVRVYDADDLAMWIEQAPAVGRWFANLRGIQAYDGRDIDAYLDAWRRRTTPPLPADLVLSGDERRRQSDDLLTWAAAPSGTSLTIRGRTREEALVFAAASLAREPGGDARLARALVVENEEAFRWALGVQGSSSLIVVPAFDKPDMGQAAAAKVRVILPADMTVPPRLSGMLTLAAQPYAPMAKALEAAGFVLADAARLIERAGGDIEALQRLCGYIDGNLPAWARDTRRVEMLALLLAGAWVPTSEGDREVLRRLGADPAVAEQLSADLQAPNVMGREVDYVPSDVLRWTSPDVAWEVLGRGLTDGLLDRFRGVVMAVLGAPDPAYELPKEERFMAAVKGKARPESDALREGLATSILRLSVHDEILAASRGGMHRGRALAEGLVGWLLRGEHGWVIWASLSRLLPTLAEASPEVFLARVQESIDRGAEGVAHLFAEEGGVLGNAPHTGVLWALELLAWHPEEKIRRRVVLALTRLDALDPPGRVGKVDNRPLQSLDTLLRYALPASRTTVEERNEFLKAVFQQDAGTGRKLALGFVRDLRGKMLLHQGTRPKFHTEWLPKHEPTEVEMTDVSRQLTFALDLLIEDAGHDGGRWAELAGAALYGPEDVEEQVLGALAAQKDVDDSRERLWTWLRKSLSHLLHGESQTHPRYDTLNALYARFTPSNLVRRYAWLFAPSPSLPGPMSDDIDEETGRLKAARDDALTELWQGDDPQQNIVELIESLRDNQYTLWNLGAAIASAHFCTGLEPLILQNTPAEPWSLLTVGYGSMRGRALGLPWLETLVGRFVGAGRIEEAAHIADGAVDWKTIKYRDVWDILGRLGKNVTSAYWKTVARIIGQPSEEDMKYAVERLAEVDRTDAGLQSAAINRQSLTGAIAFLALDKYKSKPPSVIDPSAPHYVEQLFKKIDDDPPHGRDPLKDLAPLELYYLHILPQRSRPARYVSLAFAEDPGFFVNLMNVLYRREGDPPPVEQDPVAARSAQNVHMLLRAWKGYPGEGLPEDERDQKLEAWIVEVLRKTREDGRGRVASVHVAELLARVPPANDGDWPCLAARRLLESGLDPDLAGHLSLAKRNLRGMTGRALDEGGTQEIEIAERYREASRRMENAYPRTASMLDALARIYESEAERHEAQAQPVRIRHGEQPEEEQAPPSSSRDPTAPVRRGPITRLITTGVGPAQVFDVPLSPRLNLLIGDNSLGKTFILEVLWWALSGTWAELPARPTARRGKGRSAPAATIQAETADHSLRAEYDPVKEHWKKKGTRTLAPGLALYARADGSFSVWDPIRNARVADKTDPDLSKGYHFSPRDLFYGLSAKDGITKLCRGLIEDLVSWRSERRRAYTTLEKVLGQLSLPEEPIKLGLPRRLKVRDAVTHPTLDLGYDASVVVVHASAAVKRILGLAYLLVWAVTEIQEAAPLAGLAPLDQVTLLIDEVDTHLHPRWQRVILPALLDVLEALAPSARVQLVVTTHAPLVLASVETRFDKAQDTLIELERAVGNKGRTVRVVEEPLEKLGDVNTWLVERFGIKQPRSTKAEEIIERAEAAMENPKLRKNEWKALNQQLHEVLSDADPFWVSWHYVADKRGWLS